MYKIAEWTQLRIKLIYEKLNWNIYSKYDPVGTKMKNTKEHKEEWTINTEVPVSNDFHNSTAGRIGERHNLRKYL